MTGGADNLADWLRIREHRSALLLEEDVDISLFHQVISEGYASDLDDTVLIEVGRDPFLIAYAMAAPHDRHVVASEVSKPTCRRANRRIPDVCNHFGVRWCDSFTMVRTLDFSTAWRGRLNSRPDAEAPARRP
nr:DUF4411 family protein [Xanthobacter sp. YC-JY1]